MLGLAYALGPVAISDDDYARVVIAQRFAESPALDPSGTSWLPLPFWVTGGAQLVFGATLTVARGVQWLLAFLAGGLLYALGRRWGLSRWQAVLASLLSGLLPTLRALSLATVPELWSAALAAYGLSTLLPARSPTRLPAQVTPLSSAAPPSSVAPVEAAPAVEATHIVELPPWCGALALAAATLCRYETWAAALGFSLVVGLRALRGRAHGGGELADISKMRRALVGLGPAALALSGIVAWCSHGALAHGSPLFFLTRVSQYKEALGSPAPQLLELALGYPWALVTREPELTLALALALGSAVRGRSTVSGRGPSTSNSLGWRGVRSWLFALGLSFTALLVAELRGGAPTHHPERALLIFWMSAVPPTVAWLTSLPRRHLAATVLLVSALATFVRLARPPLSGGEREDEETIGRLVREHLPPSELVALATDDYGYFAIQAAAGDPERFLVVDRHDPREPRASGAPPTRALETARRGGATYLVVPVCWELDGAVTLAHSADFRLVRVPPR